ncbi:MAG TPA: ABC transporter substrate-binding protein [Bacillota bacterium]|nr:ABC transporter substrate-binding protein [Bacillota bacterium]
MKKKLFGLMLLLSLGMLVLAGCGTGAKEEKAAGNQATTAQSTGELKKFKVGYLPTPGHVLYFVAQEKGFFKEQGLDVELFRFTNSGEGLNAIKSGKLDAGSFGTSAPLAFIAKGADFTIIGGQQSEGAGIIAQPEKAAQFQELSNFKGKKVATVRLGTGDVVFRGALVEAGIDWKKDLTIQELDSPAAVVEAVKKGAVDAGVVWAPYMKIGEKKGLKIVKYSKDLMAGHTCCRQVALTSRVKEDPETYAKFLKALIKAYDYYQVNKTETVDIIAKYVNIDKDVIEAETYGGHISSDPQPDKAGVIKFWTMMNKAGYINSNINIADHINTDIYDSALQELLKQDPQNQNYLKLKAEFVK